MNNYKVSFEFNSEDDEALDAIEEVIMEELRNQQIEAHNIQVSITKSNYTPIDIP